MGLGHIIRKIKRLEHRMVQYSRRIADLTAELAKSVSEATFDKVRKELTVAEKTVDTLQKEVLQLTADVKKAGILVATDTKEIAELTASAMHLGALATDIHKATEFLGTSFTNLSAAPAEVAAVAEGALAAATDLVPTLESRAKEIVARVPDLEILGKNALNEARKDLAEMRELGTEALQKSKHVIDVALPTTAMNILRTLETVVKGDGAAYQSQILPALHGIVQALNSHHQMHGIAEPKAIGHVVEQLKKYVLQAPSVVFDVLADLVPLTQIQTIQQTIVSASPSSQNVAPDTPVVDQERRAAGIAGSRNKELSQGAVKGLLSSVAVCKCIELVVIQLGVAFPIAAAVTVSGQGAARQTGNAGIDVVVDGILDFAVFGGAFVGLSTTYISWGALFSSLLGGLFGLIALVLEAVVAGFAIADEVST